MIDPRSIVKSYESFGGTGPKAVVAASEALQRRIDAQKSLLEADHATVDGAYARCLRIGRMAKLEQPETAEALARLVQTACSHASIVLRSTA